MSASEASDTTGRLSELMTSKFDVRIRFLDEVLDDNESVASCRMIVVAPAAVRRG